MPKREIQAKTRDEIAREYPIEGRVSGWYFRVVETSNSAWLVEGSDLWGRKVSRTGGDPESLMQAVISDAQKILAESKA